MPNTYIVNIWLTNEDKFSHDYTYERPKVQVMLNIILSLLSYQFGNILTNISSSDWPSCLIYIIKLDTTYDISPLTIHG